MPPSDYWRQTPRELAAILHGIIARQRWERDLALVGAWHVAALHRTDKLPELSALIGRADPDALPSGHVRAGEGLRAWAAAIRAQGKAN
ncbi:MAG: hypothetical protein WBF53_12040 [Litorimonas sp.]